ncbi:MAG: lysine--tRNA ligase [Candidatus Bathyarchaeota archaeon]|nr:lysine--tRNA ligase [Candidatus Bathyarchaeota archaeon]
MGRLLKSEPNEKIIGHGTWYDKMALKIIERELKLNRGLNVIRVESGIGASGIPHIGSLSEVTRNYAISLAIREHGHKSEFIVFSDNKDGLRSVPAGLPKSLGEHLGKPVMDIPDPFGCHSSYGDHMVYLLLDALDRLGVEYRFISAVEAYKRGLLNSEIRDILLNAKRVGEIVYEETGQEKYLEALPYFPVCASCGRIYTTKAYKFLPDENKVLYICEGMEVKGRWLEGCRYEGEADYTKGEGKLSWKAGEFAARWRALEIGFEAYGKDLIDSVRVNDRISREILGYEPPLHARYELFLDKSGRKISKSAGNVLTPQLWLKYGSPQSLILLTLKRFVGTRNVSISDVPRYMNEFDNLEDIYFGRIKIGDEREEAKLRGLYEYCWFLKAPSKASIHVPYNVLTYLAKIAPKGLEIDFISGKLRDYGYIRDKSEVDEGLKRRIEYALNWVKDFEEITETAISLSQNERAAIRLLIQRIQVEGDAEKIQSAIFEAARENNIEPKDFFKTLYMILLGAPSGPRLGPYIVAMGRENVIKALERSLESA